MLFECDIPHPERLFLPSPGNLYSPSGLKLKIFCHRPPPPHTHTQTLTLPGMRTYAYLPVLSLRCCTGDSPHYADSHGLFPPVCPFIEKDPNEATVQTA